MQHSTVDVEGESAVEPPAKAQQTAQEDGDGAVEAVVAEATVAVETMASSHSTVDVESEGAVEPPAKVQRTAQEDGDAAVEAVVAEATVAVEATAAVEAVGAPAAAACESSAASTVAPSETTVADGINAVANATAAATAATATAVAAVAAGILTNEAPTPAEVRLGGHKRKGPVQPVEPPPTPDMAAVVASTAIARAEADYAVGKGLKIPVGMSIAARGPTLTGRGRGSGRGGGHEDPTHVTKWSRIDQMAPPTGTRRVAPPSLHPERPSGHPAILFRPMSAALACVGEHLHACGSVQTPLRQLCCGAYAHSPHVAEAPLWARSALVECMGREYILGHARSACVGGPRLAPHPTSRPMAHSPILIPHPAAAAVADRLNYVPAIPVASVTACVSVTTAIASAQASAFAAAQAAHAITTGQGPLSASEVATAHAGNLAIAEAHMEPVVHAQPLVTAVASSGAVAREVGEVPRTVLDTTAHSPEGMGGAAEDAAAGRVASTDGTATPSSELPHPTGHELAACPAQLGSAPAPPQSEAPPEAPPAAPPEAPPASTDTELLEAQQVCNAENARSSAEAAVRAAAAAKKAAASAEAAVAAVAAAAAAAAAEVATAVGGGPGLATPAQAAASAAQAWLCEGRDRETTPPAAFDTTAVIAAHIAATAVAATANLALLSGGAGSSGAGSSGAPPTMEPPPPPSPPPPPPMDLDPETLPRTMKLAGGGQTVSFVPCSHPIPAAPPSPLPLLAPLAH